jgi:acyl-homoserine lactone acylase PvdQ
LRSRRLHILLGATLAAGAIAAAPGAAQAADYSDIARNVLAPGQAGSLPVTPNSIDQALLYDALTPLGFNVSAADVNRLYKPNVFGTRGQGPTRVEKTPNKNVRIVRDKWGVPHITGKRRSDVMYGAGFVAAEDRQLLLELARGPGRLAVLDAPGIDAFRLIVTGRTFVPSAQADAVINRQVGVLRRAGRKGRQTLADIDAYVRGMNGFFSQSGQIQSGAVKPWTRTDMIALSGFIGSIFGRGGGDEHRNAQFLGALQAKLGDAAGRSVFDDLRRVTDPESPASLERPAPYNATPANRSGNTPIDDNSFAATTFKGAPKPTEDRDRKLMSNALLVSAKRSRSGHPIFVAGPQLGYFYPEIVGEMDLHGGGIDARGIASTGAGPYVFIGRGQDFSWSLTSASNDITDVYVESLCGNSDKQYLFEGRCKQMTTTNAGVLKGSPDQQIVFSETVHGPVIGYATVGGQKVAISSKRSTRGREALSLMAFNDLNSNRVNSARTFLRSINQLEHTFNVFYADDRDIAMFSTGRLPIRPKNVDPSLPPRGTGRNEWTGFLSAAKHPQDINPRNGFILNWNNRPARQFGAADDNWSYGPTHRDELFDPLKKIKRSRPNDVVSVMNGAGTQDLRSVELTPLASDVMQGTAAPTPRAARMRDLLLDWRANGSSRLDADLDGKIDHPGAAIMDAWYPKFADAVLSPVLGELTPRLAQFRGRGGAPSSGGSAFGGGWYSYIDKDLRTLLGRSVDGKFSNRYCGKGDFNACSASLWASLDAAGAELEAAQGPDPGAWRSDATRERITFQPGLIPNTMRWVNRPTFQQVNSFDGHRRRR